ncbi:hypothetical protein CFC21_072921 [Triticum aestivum]|uniref:Uncharacterized protein n=2 Tax=Triticum aestivum TaxID=4565 RepID=A0A9R1HJC0_WHEAT|nr:hypothetical protein CFC21_072921 [Triticum aestivum]
MSSLAVGCALELELWLGGLFTAADLAAADLLLQLRLGEAEAAAFKMTSSSRRSASSCCEDLAVDAEEERIVKETAVSLGSMELDWRTRKSSANSCCENLAVDEEEERVVKERALPLGSMELERRARKRYRLLSELYAATRPAKAAAPAAKKKRKRRHDGGESESWSWSEATRYGDC